MTGFGPHSTPAGAAGDPATLRALDRSRRLTADLADQLLTHLPDLGDIGTQRALDSWVEQAADTLRALSESLEERLIDVGSAAGVPARTTQRAGAPRGTSVVSASPSAGPGPGRERT
ncbi:hypothetical protein [Intrasporangium calvum]|uniref:hypothetical protein n=1 Tax=Intrasporangium calvum TaxID=53358 RepID=UPI000DF605E7|nr:hypothetical protein [Intrasporangium calvum]AXG13955.1 hypothetical protein DN585_11560 [Intrasporangium calvum]